MPDPSAEAARREHRVLFVALLLAPVLVAAWNGAPNPLVDDPYPHLAATGWLAWLAVPVALVLLWFGRRPGVGPAALLVLPAVGWLAARGATDTFELRRALLLEGVWSVALAAGLVLVAAERRSLGRGLIVASIVATLGALWAALSAGDGALLAGSLGNTGLTSQLALPGAVLGARALLHERGAWRHLGALAVALFAGHAAGAPVVAGALAFGVGVLPSVLTRGLNGGERARALALAAVPALALLGWRVAAPAIAPASAVVEQASAQQTVGHEGAGDFGGAAIRRRIWARLPALVADAPAAGIGPGQFQAAFPPYRDPREIVLSRAGACSDATTEVNHAHQDALQVLAENGLPLGLAFLAFLAVVALRGAQRARSADPGSAQAGLGAAGLALVANGLFHAPLSANPAAAWVGFVVFGAVLTREPAQRARWTAFVPLVAALSIAGLARPLVLHGLALRDYVRTAKLAARDAAAPDVARLQRASERALLAAPDSVPAGELAARATGEAALLERALAARPDSVGLLEELGTRRARAGDPTAARELWEHALSLSADTPRLLRNLTRLAAEQGSLDQVRSHVERLRAAGCLDRAWLDTLAEELLLTGASGAGALVLGLAEEDLAGALPELLYERARRAREGGGKRRERALTSLAQLLWARDHAASGRFDVAVRSYRQALAQTRPFVEGGAPALRLELAAALWRAGRAEDARAEAAGLALDPRLAARLPAWARETLAQAGLYPRD